MPAETAPPEKQPQPDESFMQQVRKMPLTKLGKQTAKEFKDDEVTAMAAGVAYHAIFAIPPGIIFLITLAALISSVTTVDIAGRLTEIINDNAPGETRELLLDLVDSAVASVSGGWASFGVFTSALIALWSGSNGIATIMRAFNRAYDVVEDRNFVKQKLVSIGLTVLMALLVILAFTLFVFGEQIGAWVAERAGLSSAFELAWNISRWPLALFFIMFLLAVLYHLGPNIEQTWRWISPGSVVATLLWVAAVFGFKLYLQFSNPGSAYGALGSVVVLMFFLYITAIIFLVGAEVNAVLGRRYDPETVQDLALHPEKVENQEEVAVAQERAGDMAQRDDRQIAGTDERSTPHPRPKRHESKPGLAGKLGGAIGALALGAVLNRFRRGERS